MKIKPIKSITDYELALKGLEKNIYRRTWNKRRRWIRNIGNGNWRL